MRLNYVEKIPEKNGEILRPGPVISHKEFSLTLFNFVFSTKLRDLCLETHLYVFNR